MSPLIFIILLVQIFDYCVAKPELSFDDWDTNSLWGSRKTVKPWNIWKPTRTTRQPKPTRPPSQAENSGKNVGCGIQATDFVPNLSFNVKNRVINGKEAKAHSWPWVVGLINENYGGFMCGGTLLRARDNVDASDIVLTAAHCVTQRSFFSKPRPVTPSSLSVAAGRHRRKSPDQYDQVQQVAAIRAHPNYGTSAGGAPVNDIAVIKLANPIKFSDAVRPVCLPQQADAIPVNLQCVAAGWGRNDSYNQFVSAEALQQVVIPVHSADTCSNGWNDMYNAEAMVCAGTKDSGVCNGDSGSTMMCKQGDRWVQHGVVSFGVTGTCLEDGKPDVYARVASYSDWIKQQIQELTSV